MSAARAALARQQAAAARAASATTELQGRRSRCSGRRERAGGSKLGKWRGLKGSEGVCACAAGLLAALACANNPARVRPSSRQACEQRDSTALRGQSTPLARDGARR
jgi:hypothetical protein